jgi:hypothetical protein
MRKIMAVYPKIHAAQVHHHKHTNLWYVLTTSLTDHMDIADGKDHGCVLRDPCSAGLLSQEYNSMAHHHDFLDRLYGYRK